MTSIAKHQSRILVIDDEPSNVRMVERSLRDVGYANIRSTTESRDAEALFADFAPDLVVLDLGMPHMDGFAVLAALRRGGGGVPVLVVTGKDDRDARTRCLRLGANDFLAKPFDDLEIGLRVDNLLAGWSLLVCARSANAELERRVLERTAALEEAHHEILERLAKAAEFRDDDTGEHTHRVGQTSAALATRVGLSGREIDLIRRAAPLHDVGKIAIPDAVLLKPGRLTTEEFALIKTHSETGARLLGGSEIPLLAHARGIALHHHENWDGTGYPAGLKAEEIPVEARITSVADVFDALTHDRPYKKGWPAERAFAEIEMLAGSKFDPAIVRAFVGGNYPV